MLCFPPLLSSSSALFEDAIIAIMRAVRDIFTRARYYVMRYCHDITRDMSRYVYAAPLLTLPDIIAASLIRYFLLMRHAASAFSLRQRHISHYLRTLIPTRPPRHSCRRLLCQLPATL